MVFVPPKYNVLYTFEAKEDGEMSVTQGQVVALSPGEDGKYGTADDQTDGWILVEHVNAPGTFGYVPEAYLEKIPEAAPSPQAAASAPPPPPPPAEAEAPLPAPQPTPQDEQPPAAEALEGQQFHSAIRRLSDPRLPTHLLNLMDPQTLESGPAGVQGAPAAATTAAPAPEVDGLSSTLTSKSAQPAPRLGSSSPSKSSSALNSSGITPRPPVNVLRNSPAFTKALSVVNKNPLDSTKRLFSSVRAANDGGQTAAVRVPKLVAAVKAEQYDEIVAKSDQFFAALETSRTTSFSKLTDMTSALSTHIDTNLDHSTSLMSRLEKLDQILEQEKAAWDRTVEDEKIQLADVQKTADISDV